MKKKYKPDQNDFNSLHNCNIAKESLSRIYYYIENLPSLPFLIDDYVVRLEHHLMQITHY